EVLATCRTYVYRDRNDDIPCLPQPELASRVGKQLMRVGQSLALVRQKPAVTEEEFKVMKRIALDSLPSNRRLLLAVLYRHKDEEKPAETFTQAVSRVSQKTIERELNNLAELGAVRRIKRQVTKSISKAKADGTQMKVTTTKTFYRLSSRLAQYCDNIGGV